MTTSTDTPNPRVLWVLAGGNFAQLGTRIMLGALVPLVLTSFDTTKAEVGLALTAMWMVYALFQFPSGVLADRHGEPLLLLAGIGGAVLGVVLVALAPSMRWFGLFVVVLGASTGLYFSPASSLIARIYAGQGRALWTLTGAGAIAGIAYPAVGGAVGVLYGWRTALLLTLVVTVPVLVLFGRTVSGFPAAEDDGRAGDDLGLGRLRVLLTRGPFLYTILIASLLFFVLQAVSSFFPTFLVEYHGLDPGLAGVAFGLVFGLSSVSQVAVGRISDLVSRDLAIGLAASLTTLGVLVLLFAPPLVGLVAGSLLLGVGISWPGALLARIMEQVADIGRGYGIGLARTGYMVLGSLGSVVVGTTVDASGWVVGYGVLVVVLGLALALLVLNRIFSLGV